MSGVNGVATGPNRREFGLAAVAIFAALASLLALAWTMRSPSRDPTQAIITVYGSLMFTFVGVVASSTLAVPALVDPVRIRVRSIMDRRFHRARYDAERTVAGFAGRLRDQLDLTTLTTELRRTTVHAVDPTTTDVWLRGAEGAGP